MFNVHQSPALGAPGRHQQVPPHRVTFNYAASFSDLIGSSGLNRCVGPRARPCLSPIEPPSSSAARPPTIAPPGPCRSMLAMVVLQRGTFLSIMHAAAAMRGGGRGDIINTAR